MAPQFGRTGVAWAIAGFAAGIVTASLAAALAEAATGWSPRSSAPAPVAVTAADLVGLWVALVGAVVLFSRARGTGRVRDDFGVRFARWDVPVGVAAGLACQYAVIPLLYLPFERLVPGLSTRLSQPAHSETGAAHTPAALVVLLLFLAVGAPLVEELYFRGLLLRSLAGWTNPVVGVVGSGLLFGLAHFEPLQFAGLAVVGMVFGVLAWRSGRLGPSIAAHSTFNAAAVLTVVHLH